MTPDRWQTIEGLFNQAHELPPHQRSAWLDRHTDDPAIRAEVESLLACATVDEGVTSVQRAIGGAAAQAVRAVEGAAGRRIGPYRVLRLLGQGGMGSVYLAERDDAEFRKQVAIKILRSGMDGPAAVERFRQERQILAGLEHPHIARLLDGGATADGLPYLVMEYVEGQPLPAWIEERRPGIPERLRLFREVCAAVQFAHQNLVVHRDLKASNILVTADGSAKLLDFGIAKLIDDPRPDHTLTAHRAYTPNYASPEQVLGRPVTTASDVYSLGIVLFELLTGRLPFDDLERALRDAEPPRPSAAVGGREGRKLRDDLDHIVLKALRRDPAARYASVEQLSADILHYLEGRPVRARRGTLTYRARRFVSRRRWAIAAAVVAFAAVGAGVAGTIQQKRKAERRFAQVRSLANTFLFQVHDGLAELPGSLPVRLQLVKTALQYLDSLAPDARGDAALQLELATAYARVGDIQNSSSSGNLGQAREAIASWEKSVAMLRELAGRPNGIEASRRLCSTLLNLGVARYELGDFAGAESEFTRALEIAERLVAAGSDRYESLRVTSARNRLGDLKMRVGQAEEALAQYRPVLRIMQDLANPEMDSHLAVPIPTQHLRIGDALHATGDPAGAAAEYRTGLEMTTARIAAGDRRESLLRLAILARVNLGHARGGQAPHLDDPGGALTAYREAIREGLALQASDPANARVENALAIAYGEAIRLSAAGEAAELGRELRKLADALLAKSPDSIEYGQRRVAALWGLARGASAGERPARIREALAADEALRRRAPGDAEVRRRSLAMRLEFASGADALVKIAEEASAAARPDVFLRDIAASAHARLAALGRCDSYRKARAEWSGSAIAYAKRRLAELEASAPGCAAAGPANRTIVRSAFLKLLKTK